VKGEGQNAGSLLSTPSELCLGVAMLLAKKEESFLIEKKLQAIKKNL
jgi:hypothetical protein